jgi:glycosyltransferase involved in cell wall biosynthesis
LKDKFKFYFLTKNIHLWLLDSYGLFMNILMLLEREFPFDERVEKEAISLLKAGHRVIIACLTFQNKPKNELYKGIRIVRKPISSLTYKLSAAALLFSCYFFFWKRFIKQILSSEQIDAIHVHDLPLSKPAYLLSRKFKTKLVLDQHEFYSDWISHTAHYNRGLGKIVNKLSNWSRYEQKYLRLADLVITVAEPLKNIYINQVGVDESKMLMIPNTPLEESYKSAIANSFIEQKYQGYLKLFYAGGIDTLRGLDMVLKALIILKKQNHKVIFIVAGAEQKGFSIENLAKEYEVQDYLDFLGWVKGDDLPSYMAACDIGIFTPVLNRLEIHSTIPTKIYQYCAAGLPAIVSKAKLMEEFVLKNKVGFVVEDEKDLTEICLKILEDKELLIPLKSNCILVATPYFWETTSLPLVQVYSNF